MEDLTLMEKFADPSYFTGLGLGEKMIGAGVTTLMGIGITFIVLILLSAIIIFMEKIFLKIDNRNKPQAEPVVVAAAEQPVSDVSQNELIAVVTAAINAFEGSSVFSYLVVRKINRTAGPAVAWNVAGQQDQIDSRKL